MKNRAQKFNDSWLKTEVRSKHQRWLEENPSGSLDELIAWLEMVHRRCIEFIAPTFETRVECE